MSVHVSPVKTYLAIFAALMVGTAMTVAAAFQNFGPMNDVIALAIAVTKATLVVLFFMHVKYSTKLTTVVVVSGIFFLLVLFAFTLSDYVSRGWLGVPGR